MNSLDLTLDTSVRGTPVGAGQGAEVNRGQTDMGPTLRSLLDSKTPKRRGRPRKEKKSMNDANADPDMNGLEMTPDTCIPDTPVGACQGAEINRGQTDMGPTLRSLLDSSTAKRRGRPRKEKKKVNDSNSDSDMNSSELTLDTSLPDTPVGAGQGAEVNMGQTDMGPTLRSLLDSKTPKRRGRPRKEKKNMNDANADPNMNGLELTLDTCVPDTPVGACQGAEINRGQTDMGPTLRSLLDSSTSKRRGRPRKEKKNMNDSNADSDMNSLELTLDTSIPDTPGGADQGAEANMGQTDMGPTLRSLLDSKTPKRRGRPRKQKENMNDAHADSALVVRKIEESSSSWGKRERSESKYLTFPYTSILKRPRKEGKKVKYAGDDQAERSSEEVVLDLIAAAMSPLHPQNSILTKPTRGLVISFRDSLCFEDKGKNSQEVAVALSPVLLRARSKLENIITLLNESGLESKGSLIAETQGLLKKFNLPLTNYDTIDSSNDIAQNSQEVAVAPSPLLLDARDETKEMIMSPNGPGLESKDSQIGDSPELVELVNMALTNNGTIDNAQHFQEVAVASSPMQLDARDKLQEMIASPNESVLVNKGSLIVDDPRFVEKFNMTFTNSGTIDNVQHSQEVAAAPSHVLLDARDKSQEMIASPTGSVLENKHSLIRDAPGLVEKVKMALTNNGIIDNAQHSQEVAVVSSPVLVDASDKPREMITSSNGSGLVNKGSLFGAAPGLVEKVNMTLTNNGTIGPEDNLTPKERWWRELLRDAGYRI